MKRLITTALLACALLTGCASTQVENKTTTETTTVETTTAATVNTMPSDEEIIKSATTDVAPDTWFKSGSFYYYMQSDNTLAKAKMATPNSDINTSRYVDEYGRWLRVEDFPELEPYFVELLKNKKVTIPASMYEKLNLTQDDIIKMLTVYKSTTLSTWATITQYDDPNNLRLTISDGQNSVNNYDDYVKAMEKLKALNLTTLDDIIDYGLKNIHNTNGQATKLPQLYPNLYGALYSNDGTVCDGFSHYIYWACKLQGIPVKLVGITIKTKDGEIINHSLNQIYIDGEWKYFDLMWEQSALPYRSDGKLMFFDDISKYYAHDVYDEDTGITVIPDENNILIEYKD